MSQEELTTKCSYCGRSEPVQTHVDSFRGAIAMLPCKCSQVTEESVRAELAASHFIWMPSRKSVLRTPEMSAKRDILMRLVYTGQISIDMHIANPNDEIDETCLVFYNSKPQI